MILHEGWSLSGEGSRFSLANSGHGYRDESEILCFRSGPVLGWFDWGAIRYSSNINKFIACIIFVFYDLVDRSLFTRFTHF